MTIKTPVVGPQAPDPSQVQKYRIDARNNGYTVIRVRTSDKVPLAKDWPRGDPEVFDAPQASALNTGCLIKDDLAVIDLDVDHEDDVRDALTALKPHMPPGALLRYRMRGRQKAGLAYIVRCHGAEPWAIQAADHASGGIRRKVEVLVSNKQLVIDGVHHTGATIEWVRGRSPATVPLAELPTVSPQQISDMKVAVSAATGFTEKAPSARSNVIPLHGGAPQAFLDQATSLPDMNAAAQEGIDRHWFERLSPDQKNGLLREGAAQPAFQLLADQARDEWLRILWGFADAAAMGATEAYNVARAWSETSARFDAASFDRDWNSFKEGRTTVGSLLRALADSSFDLAPWRGLILGGGQGGNIAVPATGAGQPVAPLALPSAATQAFFQPVQTDTHHLHPVDWIVPGFLQRGALTGVFGPGGSSKTAAAVGIGTLLAAGCTKIGPFDAVGTDLRVVVISAEENANRINLLVAAAEGLHALNSVERAARHRNLLQHDATKSGIRFGEARLNVREDIAPEAFDTALIQLRSALASTKVDLLILDTLSALIALPSEIDNGLITTMLRRLVRVAQDFNCAVLLLHHTRKASKETLSAASGDPDIIRGGSAITNVCRVALTLTGLTMNDAARATRAGFNADHVRCLAHAKSNDAAFMDPAFVMTEAVQVQMANGTTQDVRAVKFITLPPPLNAAAGSAGSAVQTAMQQQVDQQVRQAVITATQQGALDKHGAWVPLSQGNREHSAIIAYTGAIQAAIGCAETVAKRLAKDELAALKTLGAIVDEKVKVPKYTPEGGRNGENTRRGLRVVAGVLAPVVSAPGQAPTPELRPDNPTVGEAITPDDGTVIADQAASVIAAADRLAANPRSDDNG